MLAIDKAIELVTKLDRTINYPKEMPSVVNLARGLQKAADTMMVSASLIVEKCAEASQFCPTDADLLTVARELRDENRRKNQPDVTKEWQAMYGAPKPFDWKQIDNGKAKHVKDRERQLLNAIKAKYPGELSWHAMIEAAKELGYPDYAEAWTKGMVGGKS